MAFDRGHTAAMGKLYFPCTVNVSILQFTYTPLARSRSHDLRIALDDLECQTLWHDSRNFHGSELQNVKVFQSIPQLCARNRV